MQRYTALDLEILFPFSISEARDCIAQGSFAYDYKTPSYYACRKEKQLEQS